MLLDSALLLLDAHAIAYLVHYMYPTPSPNTCPVALTDTTLLTRPYRYFPSESRNTFYLPTVARQYGHPARQNRLPLASIFPLYKLCPQKL